MTLLKGTLQTPSGCSNLERREILPFLTVTPQSFLIYNYQDSEVSVERLP